MDNFIEKSIDLTLPGAEYEIKNILLQDGIYTMKRFYTVT